jgi:hypothetical protein
MTNLAPTDKRLRLGVYSRAIERGAIGDVSGSSREGKFLRAVERELSQHVGGAPTFPQKILIRRCARKLLQLEMLDAKFAADEWTPHDGRTYGGLSNSLRLDLKALGGPAESNKTPSLDAILAGHASPKAASA